MNATRESQINKKPELLQLLRKWLFSPPVTITEIGARSRAELLSGFAFILTLSTGMGTIVGYIVTAGGFRSATVSLIITTVLSLIAYILSRTRYFIAGSALITLALSLTSFMTIIGGTETISSALYSSIPIALVLASALFSVRGLVITLVGNLAGIILLPFFLANVTPQVIGSAPGIIGTFGILLIIVNRARNRIERARLAELEQTNQELDKLRASLETLVEERTLELEERSKELVNSTTFLNTVIENLPVMLFMKEGENLSFVRWNNAAEELTGLKREDLLGKNDTDFFPEEEAAFFVTKDRQVLAGDKALDIPEEPIQTVHRGLRWLHTHKTPIIGPDGKSRFLLGVSEDITERRQFGATLAKRAAELQTVAEVSTAMTTIQEVGALLQEVVDLTKERFHLYHAHVYLLNESGDTLALRAGAGEAGRAMTAQGRTIPLDHPSSLVARAGRTRQAVIANDVSQAPDFLPNPLLPDTKSEMAVPLLIGERVLGVLDVQSDQLGYFADDDQRIQTILADQVAVAISNAAQYTYEQIQTKRLSSLVENTAGLTDPQIGMDALMNLIVRNAIQLLEADDAGLWLAISQDEIELRTNRHNDHLLGARLKYGEGLSGRAIATGQVFRVDDYAAWSGRALTETSIRVAMAVPLIWQGKPIGALALTREKIGHEFVEEDEHTAQLFASQVASAIENVRSFERTQQTLHELDTLNRRLSREGWQTYLAEAEREHIGFVFEGDQLVPLQDNWQSEGDAGHEAEKTFVQPVILRGERIGQLVASETGMEEEDLQTVLAAVSQGLSAHLENLRLTEEAERRVNELDIVNEIGQALATEVDLQTILATVVNNLSYAFNANIAYAALYDPDRQIIHIPYMLDHGRVILNEPPFPFGDGINSTIIRSRQRIFINQDTERRLRELGAVPTVTNDEMAKSFIGVPLISGEIVIGVLSIQDGEREGRFTQGDVDLLTTIASNVAVAVQNAQLFAQTQKRAEREATVNLIGQKIQSATTVQGALQTAIQELGLALKARRTVVELAKRPAVDEGSQKPKKVTGALPSLKKENS